MNNDPRVIQRIALSMRLSVEVIAVDPVFALDVIYKFIADA
jgi:hypothetical protein